MAIPETQLDTWAHQGSITQSSTTYGTIRAALEASAAAYVGGDFTVFLQGSYGNDTNIYADSDVDVVIQLNSAVYYSDHELPEAIRTQRRQGISAATYTHVEFKRDVIARLRSAFPNQVALGNKAIYIAPAGNRRAADVLVAAKFRRYYLRQGSTVPTYYEGLCFFTPSGTRVVNYPKLHAARCTDKHQATHQWFKPLVRIFKNMRNRAVSDGRLAAGVAPSYFLEGMLYNVPDTLFGGSYGQSATNALVWLRDCDRSALVTASGQHYLVRTDSSTSWRPEDFETFLAVMIDQWNLW
jgi:hypothetical protein